MDKGVWLRDIYPLFVKTGSGVCLSERLVGFLGFVRSFVVQSFTGVSPF